MNTHVPVLLQEVLSHLDLQTGHVVVDATLGAGGYSREILKRIDPGGALVAFDRDVEAIKAFRENIPTLTSDSSLHLVHENYSNIPLELEKLNISQVNGIVADLGISSDQLADGKRGISFLSEGPLDMRLDQEEDVPTAAHIVNTYSEEDLVHLFQTYAQEKYARSIVRGILSKRTELPFETTKDLVECIERHTPASYKRAKIHPATKVFMALRMQVNKEIDHLEAFLESAFGVLSPGGRMVVVTFHSIEDRVVKEFVRKNARGCVCPDEFPICRCGKEPLCTIVTRKPVVPTMDEIRENPRSRSAKLRALEKI